jgi:hypothetical protein
LVAIAVLNILTGWTFIGWLMASHLAPDRGSIKAWMQSNFTQAEKTARSARRLGFKWISGAI